MNQQNRQQRIKELIAFGMSPEDSAEAVDMHDGVQKPDLQNGVDYKDSKPIHELYQQYAPTKKQ